MLVTREMQFNTTMKGYYTLNRMSEMKKIDQVLAQIWGDRMEYSNAAGENVHKCTTPLENILWFPKKVKQTPTILNIY